jgi:hypothetical protein
MNDTDRLERRYRRLLSLYPRAFRRDHEQEMLGVLLDGAPDGASRPRLGEWLNLMRGALVMYVRHPSQPGRWERAHAQVMLPLRILLGLWLTFLTVVLLSLSSAPLWALLTGPFALLHFWFAYQLRRFPATPA